MRTRIKICGLTTVEAALASAAAGADAVGLMFVEASPRVVTIQQATQIVSALPAFVEPIGLFVNRPVEQVLDTAGQLGLRCVQLHGSETPEDVAQLTGLRVIKALGFEDANQARKAMNNWRDPPPQLAGLMFDAKPPADAAIPGGLGQTFDWQALTELLSDPAFEHLPPVILAGGLTPGNVAEAIRVVKPYAVDVSSGVESQRGVKDIGLIARFCQAVQG